MDISSIRAFLVVARYGSFSKASEHLFITQPAVSKRVSSLESELGVELFNRVARTITLTEAGKRLVDRAQDVVDRADDLHRFAQSLSDDIAGNLPISIAHHIGLHRMPPVLRAFNRQFPAVNLDIRFEDSDQALASVERGDIEFGVITLPSETQPNVIREVVWQDSLTFVVAGDHPLAKVSKLTLSDLQDYACVLPNKETETHKIVARSFAEQGHSLNVQMQTNSLETLKMLVGTGIGWSVLPAKMLEDGNLVSLTLETQLNRSLGFVYHSKRTQSNAATALMASIREHAAA